MKYKLFIIFLLLAVNIYANEWRWQNPKPQSNTLHSVKFFNEWYGYAVGDHGTILFSNNGGISWEIQYEGITDNFEEISVIDSLTAVIVGDNGMIVKTTNCGTTWFEQNSGTESGLNGVWFIDKNYGWACGDERTILKTVDGGVTWIRINFMGGGIPPTISFNSIFFLNQNEGWMVGSNGYILRSTNGGSNWTVQKSSGETALRVRFYNNTSGFVVGSNGSILKTINSGSSWTQIPSNTNFGLNDIYFHSSTSFYIVGDNGTILKSTNSGGSWFSESLNSITSINSLSGFNSTMCAVGEFGFLAKKLNSSPWVIINSGNHKSVNWINFSDYQNGIAVGQYGLIMKTTDSGNNWIEQTSGITGDSFYGLEMIDKDNAWVVGDLGIILRTSNGGTNWYQQTSNTNFTLFSVSFTDLNNGWICGDGGTLLHTTNGGLNWIKVSSGTSEILFGVKFKNQQTGWLVGSNGLIRKTTNGGSSWFNQTSPTSNGILYVDFIDLNFGFAAGSYGAILKTTNGGSNWTISPTGLLNNIYLVSGKSLNSVYAIGDSGLILHSFNGGNTWTKEFAKTGWDLFGLKVMNDSVAWVCGDYGTILATGTPPTIQKNISLLKPQSGEIWEVGIPQQILWTSQNINQIKIELSIDNGVTWTHLGTVPAQQDSFYFIPTIISSACFVKISDAEGNLFDKNPKPFSIIPKTVVKENDYIRKFMLYQNYPNPFNPTTSINFEIPTKSHATLKLYDLLGELIATLIDEEKSPGFHSYRLNLNQISKDLPSGIYFYELQADGYSLVKKMTFLR